MSMCRKCDFGRCYPYFFLSVSRKKKVTKKKDCRLHFLSYSGRAFR